MNRDGDLRVGWFFGTKVGYGCDELFHCGNGIGLPD